MQIGIVVNVMDSGDSGQTTYRLAAACADAGEQVWIMSGGNFTFDSDDTIRVRARTVPTGRYPTSEKFLKALNGSDRLEEWISVSDLDVLLLRNNPSVQTPWAQHAPIHFGREAIKSGVIVLNHPNGLTRAMNKMYLQDFPEMVRPRTLITRSSEQIRKFVREEGTVVLKPLQGSGGNSVFLLRQDDHQNVEQLIKAVARDGYIVVQEYLSAVQEGDTRLFLMNGVPLQHKGHFAAFRRIRSGEDLRSNIHAGGKLRPAQLTDTHFRLAEMVRPKLVEDGMFLVGLDIVGDKLMEINVFTPGGLGSAQKFEKVDFTECVIDALRRKVDYVRYYRKIFRNVEIATL